MYQQSKYHVFLWPSSLRHQVISRHDIDSVEYVGSCFTWGRISGTCVVSLWGNDIKCNIYVYVPSKKITRNGLRIDAARYIYIMGIIIRQRRLSYYLHHIFLQNWSWHNGVTPLNPRLLYTVDNTTLFSLILSRWRVKWLWTFWSSHAAYIKSFKGSQV